MTESVANATQILPCSKKYVVDELFAYVEFIKNNGSYQGNRYQSHKSGISDVPV